MSQIPEKGLIVQISVSPTLFHPKQTRKGAQCSKYRNCPLSTETNYLYFVTVQHCFFGLFSTSKCIHFVYSKKRCSRCHIQFTIIKKYFGYLPLKTCIGLEIFNSSPVFQGVRSKPNFAVLSTPNKREKAKHPVCPNLRFSD